MPPPPSRPTSTVARPDPPALIAPERGARVSEPIVLFRWHEVPEADGYWLQVASDADFQTLQFDGFVGPSTQLKRRDLAGPADRTYFWRMRSRSAGSWSAYSPEFHFEIATRPPRSVEARNEPQSQASGTAAPPLLVAPVKGEPVEGSAATLTWRDVPDAEDYQVQVAADDAFNELVFDAQVENTSSLTLFELLPEDDSVFYWRVRPAGKTGWQPWSKTAAFVASSLDAVEAHQRTREEGRRRAAATTRPAPVQEEDIALPSRYGRTSRSEAAVAVAIMAASFLLTILLLFQLAFNIL
jgi:hypothetical protein